MAHLKEPRGYIEDFDPIWYIDNYVATLEQQKDHHGAYAFLLDFLHETFETGALKGDKLLDIGTGPTVTPVISASRFVSEIHLSDISPINRAMVQTWLNGNKQTGNTKVFQYICEKENKSVALEDRMDMVRKKVTHIFDIDIRSPDPLPGSKDQYDVIIATLVLCGAATSLEEIRDMVGRLVLMMKPGGHLIVVDCLNCDWYQIGEFRFPYVGIGVGEVEGLFSRDDMRVVNVKTTEPGYSTVDKIKNCSNERGIFGVVCRRI